MLDVVHGRQKLSLFNAHHDEYFFLSIHVYRAESGHCVAVLLCPEKIPLGNPLCDEVPVQATVAARIACTRLGVGIR